MIKIDHNYTDYRDDTDPEYPGGKAVDATTSEGTDGTPLLADWMNDINGARQALFLEAFGDINKVSGKPDNAQESDVLKSIKKITETYAVSALVDESKCRNLLNVLGVRTVYSDEPASKDELKRAMKILHDKINADGQADFSGLRLGDYLDLPELNDGERTYKWSGEYKNLRIIISAFNLYKGAGIPENKKNHIVFMFRNCVLRRRMNKTIVSRYYYSELDAYIDGGFKTGLEAVLGKYLYAINREFDYEKVKWKPRTVFLLTEREVFGVNIVSRIGDDRECQGQYPIFRDGALYKVKRYNGSRMGWWTISYDYGHLDQGLFCVCGGSGESGVDYVGGSVYSGAGVSPVFCVA